jgi:hypothetical protein
MNSMSTLDDELELLEELDEEPGETGAPVAIGRERRVEVEMPAELEVRRTAIAQYHPSQQMMLSNIPAADLTQRDYLRVGQCQGGRRTLCPRNGPAAACEPAA